MVKETPEMIDQPRRSGGLELPFRSEQGREGNGSGRPWVGGQTHVPAVAEEVLEVEEPARPEAHGIHAATGWLFRAQEPPRPLDVAELPELVKVDENFAWVDLSEYGEHDLHAVAALLGIDDVGVGAAASQWQRPTLDLFGEHFLATATVAHVDRALYKVRAGQLDLFVGRNFLLSAHRLPLPFAERILSRAQQSPELVQLDSAFMLYIILDELLQYYEDLTEDVAEEIEQMEEQALTDASDDFLLDLLHFKRYIFTFSRLVEQHRNVFAAFRRPDFPFVATKDVHPYYRDLEERLGGVIAMLAGAKDAANGTFGIYVSNVSHRTNHEIKLLTIVSTVVLPSTVILGFLSATFEGLPLFGPRVFWLMLVSILLVSAATLFAFYRRRWL